MNGIVIEPRVKLNGQTRWHVLVDGTSVGQFYTRENARRFVRRELLPALCGVTA